MREYWIVYPLERIIMVHYLGEDGRYGEIQTFSVEDRLPVRVLESLTLELSRIFTSFS